MLTTGAPSYPNSTFFKPAEVRLVSRWPLSWSDHKSAYVLVSSRIYWKVANEDGTNRPRSFLDFRNADSVELSRLDDGTWNDVKNEIKLDNHSDRPRITVFGRLHRRTLRNNPFIVVKVYVSIIPSTPEQLDVWLGQLRARIAPWSLLQRELKYIANRAPSSGVDGLEQFLGGFMNGKLDEEPFSISTNEVENKWSENLITLREQLQKLSIVDQAIAHGTAAMETGAILSKFVKKISCSRF